MKHQIGTRHDLQGLQGQGARQGRKAHQLGDARRCAAVTTGSRVEYGETGPTVPRTREAIVPRQDHSSTLVAPPHDHGFEGSAGSADGPPPALVALALAAQARCGECVGHHAQQATAGGATRRELLEALGTALLLSRDQAETWASLADAALEAHWRGAS